MNKISKVLYLLAFPFESRDVKRFGIRDMLNSGYDVTVFDLTEFFLKGYKCKKNFNNERELFKVKYINSKTDFIKFIGEFGEDSYAFNFMDLDQDSYYILNTLSKRKIPYGIFRINLLPEPNVENLKTSIFEWVGTFLNDLKRKLKYLNINKLKRFLFKINPKLKAKLYRADVLVVGGDRAKSFHSPMVSTHTHILEAHALDYDLFLSHPPIENNNPRKTAIFLDEYFPFHSDYQILQRKPCVTAESYYPLLSRFFDKVEKQLSLRVIIASHPRSEYKDPKMYFGDREVKYGNTVELVRDSSLVILHFSTAVNFAVLYLKPTIFITSNQIDIDYSLQIKNMSKSLGSPLLNLDKTIDCDWSSVMDFSKNKYLSYTAKYIKSPNSENKFFWEIVSGYLNNGINK